MKTWEGIKLIEEKEGISLYSETGQVTIFKKDGDLFSRCDGSPYEDTWNFNFSYDDWEVVKEPVDFITAVKAFEEGKSVYCECLNTVFRYVPNDCHEKLEDTNQNAIGTHEILEGKWFIEE